MFDVLNTIITYQNEEIQTKTLFNERIKKANLFDFNELLQL
jgi:hypothetical protein